MLAYHYTKGYNLNGILKRNVLFPSPPLECYGLSREKVEANPGMHGFSVARSGSRMAYFNERVPHPEGGLAAASWFSGERFATSFSLGPWCASTLDYEPDDMLEKGCAFRLALDLEGLPVFGWDRYQQETNIPSFWRVRLGERSRRMGDNLSEWAFVLGPVQLAGRLVDVEQYHGGKWTGMDEWAERAALKELYDSPPLKGQARPRFVARFVRLSADGRHTLLRSVCTDNGRVVADHLWVDRAWDHLTPGDVIEFHATVVRYRRKNGETSYTLADANGVMRHDMAAVA